MPLTMLLWVVGIITPIFQLRTQMLSKVALLGSYREELSSGGLSGSESRNTFVSWAMELYCRAPDYSVQVKGGGDF